MPEAVRKRGGHIVYTVRENNFMGVAPYLRYTFTSSN